MDLAAFHSHRLAPSPNYAARALALSLAIHVMVFGTLELSRHLRLHLPEWLKAMLTPPAARMEERKHPLVSQEAPLLFVEVDPSQAAPEPPQDTKNYSVVNSQASNPDVATESNQPKLDGTQDKVPKVLDALRPAPPQPLTPLVPEPKPFQPEPETSPERKSGDLALAKPAETKPKEEEKPKRPRTLAEAKLQKGLLAGQKMKQEGGVKRHGSVYAFDAKGTAVGVYDAELIQAVQQCWYNLLDETTSPTRPGKVVVEFQLHSDGYVTDVKVMESDVGELHSLFCQTAIQKPAPFKRWPDGMRKEIGRDYRQLKFTFFYEY